MLWEEMITEEIKHTYNENKNSTKISVLKLSVLLTEKKNYESKK